MEQSDESVGLVERVAALDLGKAGVVACLRVPHEDKPGRRRQEIREYLTLSLARRLGKNRAIVAVGNSVLTIIWHLLADPEAHFIDLGPHFYQSRINTARKERDLIRQLEHLTGNKVTLTPPQPAA